LLDKLFHAVISVSVINHALEKDIKKAIENIFTVLKDNGLFWLICCLSKIADMAQAINLRKEHFGLWRISRKDNFRKYIISFHGEKS